MEFSFNINVDLPTEVVIVNSHQNFLRVNGIDSCDDDIAHLEKYVFNDFTRSTDTQTWKLTQDRLGKCVDVMGQKSAQAQGLKEPITSAVKLIRSDHRLYMIKDASANSGMGALIGILKVGRKRLFLTNDDGEQVEVTPMCLLDFYIEESRQRQGYGLHVFEVMLELERIAPVQLAIDRPSVNLLSFLRKHYKLDQPQFHPNKYVVFPGFLKSIREGTTGVGTDKRTGSRENHDGQTSRQFVSLNRNEKLQNISSLSSSSSNAYSDAPYMSSSSRATAKRCQETALTPSRFENNRKWQQMYDSWNVIGVPPRDYSYLSNGRYPPLRPEIGKTVMP